MIESHESVKYIRFNINDNKCMRITCDKLDCGFYRERRFDIEYSTNGTSGCMALVQTVCWSGKVYLVMKLNRLATNFDPRVRQQPSHNEGALQ